MSETVGVVWSRLDKSRQDTKEIQKEDDTTDVKNRSRMKKAMI